MKDGTRIRHAERAHRVEFAHEVGGDRPQAQRTIDTKTWTKLIRLEHRVGIGIYARPELGDSGGFHRQAGRLLVTAESEEYVGAMLQGGEHVEIRNASTGSMGHSPFDRQDDCRLVECIHELRGGNTDDTAMPSISTDHQDVMRADGRVRFDAPASLGNEVCFFLLPPE